MACSDDMHAHYGMLGAYQQTLLAAAVCAVLQTIASCSHAAEALSVSRPPVIPSLESAMSRAWQMALQVRMQHTPGHARLEHAVRHSSMSLTMVNDRC
jgi:hypothetical protein